MPSSAVPVGVHPESFFHVAVKTAALDASETFYREHFDAEVVDRGDAADGQGATAVNHVTLDVADNLVYLFDQAPYEAAGLTDGLPPGFLHFGYVVADVDAAAADLAADGIPFVMEPTDFGPLRVAFFRSPGGVRIELIETSGG